MTRSVLPLIGGALVVSAVSLFVARSPVVEFLPAITNVGSSGHAPNGVFVPNLGEAPMDAYFYLRRQGSVVLLKSKTIDLEVGIGASTAAPRHSSLRFIGVSGSPRVSGLDVLAIGTGFRSVRYEGL